MAPVLIDGHILTDFEAGCSGAALERAVARKLGLPESDFYLTQNGRKLSYADSDPLANCPVHAVLRLVGGKGGFGSMLRAIGAQIEKTTNREACRDLNGRRLRDINEEKRLKAWLDKQKDKESEVYAKKKQKLERLLAKPKHEFKDADYEQARSELTTNVAAAVEEGFKRAALKAAEAGPSGTAGVKRKLQPAGSYKKTIKGSSLWIGDDISSGSDDSSDDSSDDENDRKKNKKVCK